MVPPSSVDRYIAPPNQAYVASLATLQTSLEQAAAQPGAVNDAAAAQVLGNATNAKSASRAVALRRQLFPDGHRDLAKAMNDLAITVMLQGQTA